MPEFHLGPAAGAKVPVNAGQAVTGPITSKESASTTPPSATPASAVVSSTRTAYLPQLDGLRALAILMVFAHHAYAVPLLWSGVDLFFILSGFLITNILLRDSGRMGFGKLLGHFYLRRAQRILPAYVLALALIALFTAEDWRRLWPYYAFFLQNLPYAFHLLGFSPLIPFWSLAVEQHFYLVWPFLVFFLPRRWLGPGMLAILLGLPVLRALCTPLFSTSEPIYALTPFRIDTMAAGALAALWLPRCNPRRALRWAQIAMLFGVVAYALLALHPWFRRNANTPQFNSLAYSLNIVILGGLFVWTLVAPATNWVIRLLAIAPLRGLGRISYAFYLFHLLVLLRFSRYFSPRLAPPAAFLLTVALATLSWKLLEQPILKLGGGRRGASLRTQAT